MNPLINLINIFKIRKILKHKIQKKINKIILLNITKNLTTIIIMNKLKLI